MVYIVMLAYNRTEVVADALDRFKNVIKFYPKLDYTFALFNPQYPLNKDPNLIKGLCDPDWLYYVIENKGVAGNYNQVIDKLDIRNDDIVHFFDPDNAPINSAYLDDMIHVLSCPVVAYATLERPDPDIPYGNEIIIDGVTCYRIMKGHSWPMGGFRGDFLKKDYTINQYNFHLGLI
jgi:hypothetical protein